MYEFIREPEAIFWAFVFPIVMAIALGIAFPSTGESPVIVGVEQTAGGERIREALSRVDGIVVRDVAPDRVTQAREILHCTFSPREQQPDRAQNG